MAVFIANCPHCGAEEMTFPIFGAIPMEAANYNSSTRITASVAGECSRCHKPVCATLSRHRPVNFPHASFAQNVGVLSSASTTLDSVHLVLDEYWPKPDRVTVPEALPAVVERAFRQAERNYLLPDCEEAAATMYRRALEVGLKLAFPDVKGMLDARLKALIVSHDLPPSIGEWANEVKLIGNDGAHDLEGVSKADLDDARAFIDTVLRYIFTLPAQISARKSGTDPKDAAA